MKTWKKLVAVLLVIITFTFTTAIFEKKAEAGVITTSITIASAVVTLYELGKIHSEAYDSYHSGTWHYIHDWASKNLGIVGHVMTMNTEAEFFDNIVKPVLVRHGILSSEDTMDETSYNKWKSYVDNHYELNNDGTITYDNSMKTIFNDFINEDRGQISFVYPYDLQLSNGLGNVAGMIATLQANNPNKLYFHNNYVSLDRSVLYELDNTGDLYFVLASIDNGIMVCYLYKAINNGGVLSLEQFNPSTWDCNRYTISNGEFVLNNESKPTWLNISVIDQYPIAYSGSFNGNKTEWFSNKGINIPYFASLQSLQNYINSIGIGKYPYYTDNSVYNDWSQSSGDYTLTTDNSNLTTYGDIKNYINSFNSENGGYPSASDINVFIQSNNEDTRQEINNPGGQGGQGGQGGTGGSATATANNEGINININNNHSLIIGGQTLSGNSVSGNGNGSSGGFFDWLGRLGDTIGNLIKGIGEAITGIFEGVAEAVTTIISGIPNILSPLISFIFEGLPEEITSFMTLGITCVIFIAVVKAIKR